MKNWQDTPFTKRLGIPYPIVQGPFGGGYSSALLASTVSNAGGLGSFGMADLSPQQILDTAAEIRSLTSNPFGLNLWVSTHDEGAETYTAAKIEQAMKALEPYYRELGLERPEPPVGTIHNFEDQAAALIEARPAVFSFVFGVPSAQILRQCRRRGVLTAGGATSLDEALALEAAGVDMVVASGFEAGGHRPSFLERAEDSLIGAMALVTQISSRVKIPVIAAGGMVDGRGVAAALVAGADAAQIGTAFLACVESGANQLHRRMLFSDQARHTVLTRAFSGRLARSIRNRFHLEMGNRPELLAPYPVQSWLAGTLRKAAIEQGRADLISLWAGQGTPLLRLRSADQLMQSLITESEAIFSEFQEK